MGDEVTRGPVTTRGCWWLVEAVSRLLERGERDAVRGDLAESGASSGPALLDVLGLVVRRQAASWLEPWPWLALAGVALPIGILLSHVSRTWADGTAIYAFLYVNNWTSSFLESPGSRRDMVVLATGFLVNGLTLTSWSWTSGFVLGALSRRTVWITASLFCLAVLAGTVGTDTTARNHFNSEVFSVRFYGVVFPRLLRVTFVLLPAVWGMQWSRRRPSPPLLPAVVGLVATMVLTAWAARDLEGSVVFGRGLIPSDPGVDGFVGTSDDPRPWWGLPLVMIWPAAYIVATTTWQRWRRGPTAG